MITIVRAAQHDELRVIRMASALGAIVTGLDLSQGIGSGIHRNSGSDAAAFGYLHT